jgi:hypothetical protein
MRTQQDDKVLDFLQDIIEVYRRHRMSLAVDDGAFHVQSLTRENVTWLLGAKNQLEEEPLNEKKSVLIES